MKLVGWEKAVVSRQVQELHFGDMSLQVCRKHGVPIKSKFTFN